MKTLRYFLILLMILSSTGWAFSGVIPEMKEYMRFYFLVPLCLAEIL